MMFKLLLRTGGARVRGAMALGCLVLWGAAAEAAKPKQVPFKETLVLEGFSDDGSEAYYSGHGTHVGKISAVETFFPDGPTGPFARYVKTAANGDQLFGTIIPDNILDPFTTGILTIDGGTGRFEGATGIAEYFIDLAVGPIAQVEGTISTVGSGK